MTIPTRYSIVRYSTPPGLTEYYVSDKLLGLLQILLYNRQKSMLPVIMGISVCDKRFCLSKKEAYRDSVYYTTTNEWIIDKFL